MADEELARLHRRMLLRRQGYDRHRTHVQEYRAYARSIAEKLPFPWHPVGCHNPSNDRQGNSYGADHIVLDTAISIGRLYRQAGDALCKPWRDFNGNLWADSDGPTCKRCLDIASRLMQPQPPA